MSASPLVTVLLPVWNGASLPLIAEGEEPLRVAIRSLARQEAAPDAPVPGFGCPGGGISLPARPASSA